MVGPLVAISGAHGVGKTTLIAAVKDVRPSVAVVGNVMRGLALEGYAIGPNVEPRTVDAYLQRQAASEAAAESATIRLSDRVAIDGLAYVLASRQMGLGHPWSDAEVERARALSVEHARRCDMRVVIPVEFELAKDHFLFDLGEEFRVTVNRHLEAELTKAGLEYSVVRGGAYDRRDQLLRYLDDRWGADVGSGSTH